MVYGKGIGKTKRIRVYNSSNRIEKIPSGENAFSIEYNIPPNRFFEYPWDHNNKILINDDYNYNSLHY